MVGYGVFLLDIFFYGGYENFVKMIDEVEVLEFLMVVKNMWGYRGKVVFLVWDKYYLVDLSYFICYEVLYLF